MINHSDRRRPSRWIPNLDLGLVSTDVLSHSLRPHQRILLAPEAPLRGSTPETPPESSPIPISGVAVGSYNTTFSV